MIRLDLEDRIGFLTLARPEKRNAMTPEMLDEFAGAVESLPVAARCLVLRGDGPTFCAGFDLKLCAADPSGDVMRRLLTGLSRCVRALRALDAPVVAGIHGAAVAGGCALLGGADVVIAERQTRLGYPVARIGVSPAVSAPFLTATVADGPARTLLLDPELVTADRALSIGLVHEVADGTDALHHRAIEVARLLAAKPGRGVSATKRLLNDLARDRTGHADAALDVSLARVGSPEERERLTALWT